MAQRLDCFASHRLADVLRTKIIGGTCLPGSPIPSHRQLRAGHGVGLNTAQAAVRMLVADGHVEIRPARGAYMRDGDDQTLDAELADLRAALRRSKEDIESAESWIAVLPSRLRPEDGVR